MRSPNGGISIFRLATDMVPNWNGLVYPLLLPYMTVLENNNDYSVLVTDLGPCIMLSEVVSLILSMGWW